LSWSPVGGLLVDMSELSIRIGPATDQDRYLRTDHTVWFNEVGGASTAEQLLGVPERLRFAAEVDGADPATYPGIYGVRPMTLSIPDRDTRARQVPCAGLTWVGVHPDHRRRGILTAMLKHHFEQVRDEAGTHVSALHASEPAIYGRHGYGLASLELTVALGRGTTMTAPHLETAVTAVRTQLATISDDGMPTRLRDCELRCASTNMGAIVGDEDYYTMVCQERPEDLRDKESIRVLFARRDGVDVGLAAFRRTHKWERGRPGGELTVFMLAGDPAARLALARRLVDFDLMGTVKIEGVGVDDPLLHWVGGPRGAGDVITYDSLWIRLVDLAEALEARAYSAPCDVVVDVRDSSAPWNEGCWQVQVNDAAGAAVARTGAEPDLRLPVEALGAAYLGGANLVSMLRAGLIEELRPGACLELWRALRTDVAPGTAIGF
jgi:GNAT superfamily N-acetyltransferase